MKFKLFHVKLFLACLLAVCLLAGPVWAAGTVTVTTYQMSKDGNVFTIKLACVGDGSDGSVPATEITHDDLNTSATIFRTTKEYYRQGFYLYEVWANGGSPLPDAADISIADATGAVLYSETGIIPASTTPSEGTVGKPRAVTSALTVTVSNQDTASAVFNIYLRLVR